MWTDKSNILLITYDSNFLAQSTFELHKHFKIQRANSEQMAFFMIRELEIDLILIDLESPLQDTIQNFRRSFGYNIGLVGVSSNSKNSFQSAFRAGCDLCYQGNQFDSFSLMSLFALRKRLSRTVQKEERATPSSRRNERGFIKLGELTVYPNDYLVNYRGEKLKVSPTQFKLLLSFVTKPDVLLTREWLIENIWEGCSISHRSVDAHISKLKKLVPNLVNSLINVYGQGYILNSKNIESEALVKKSA